MAKKLYLANRGTVHSDKFFSFESFGLLPSRKEAWVALSVLKHQV
jgi:hypothetical protein